MTRLFSFLFISVLSFISFSQDLSVLFIGNSLTYSNDLPGIIRDIGRAHDLKVKTKCICLPNYALEDHWADGEIQKEISSNSFDYVVFQQGPSSQEYGRTSLVEYGGKISSLAKKHDAVPIYFMVWPSMRYYQTMKDVQLNHSEAAKQNGAEIAQVGVIWHELLSQNLNIPLYGPDKFHPSVKGSRLAAAIIFQTMVSEAPGQLRSYLAEYFKPEEINTILSD